VRVQGSGEMAASLELFIWSNETVVGRKQNTLLGSVTGKRLVKTN
jgi:hypothetical protein